ncbi:MAG: NAD-glutamate dehydrogenase domain-containing protein [Myxococcota bacterium]
MSTGEHAVEAAPSEKTLESFLREQLESVTDAQELRRYSPGFLSEIARDAAPLVERLLPGELHVRVSNPGGKRRGRTVIEVLVADQVFLVDTLRLSLNRLELRALLLLHPLLPVEREEDGSILRLGKSAVPRTRESYIYAEVPLVESETRRDEIGAELRRVLLSAQSIVSDHMRMLQELHNHAALLAKPAADLQLDPDQGLMGFLRWLADDNYVFVGYRHYEVRRTDEDWEVKTDPSSGLGVLRDERDSRFLEGMRGNEIPPLVRARLEDERLVYYDKSRVEATIHRHGRLDSISIKMFDDAGEFVGFGRFVGMLTHQAIRTRPSAIPLLAQKRELVLNRIGAEKGSHTYKAAIEAFDSLPVEFLFPCEVREITEAVQHILKASEHHQVEVCVVPNERDRSFFASVVLPLELYNEQLRHDIHGLLLERYQASYVDDRSSFVDEDIALMHFFCSGPGDIELDVLAELESDIRERAEPWADRLQKVLLASFPSDRAERLHEEYASAFPEEYRLVTPPAEAGRDIEQIEQLRWGDSPVELRLGAHERGDERSARLKVYQIERPYLTDVLPVLDRFGIRVIDAALTRIANGGCGSSWIVTFRVEELSGFRRCGEGLERRVLDGLRAALSGHIENDSLNCLIQVAGLDWRSVDLLRAYLAYSRQVGSNVLRSVARDSLLRYPGATRALLGLFSARFDPATAGDRSRASAEAAQRLERERDPITTAGDDQVFGILANLIESTLRTSFFARDGTDGRHLIAFKISPEKVNGMPSPRPWVEIYVHSARMEGVHMRAGPVARGGVRWSDRDQDLRTEVLGLMKTQMVKNGLIVPVGAKGGFVLKERIDDPASRRDEVKRQYVRFISALLALTDNIVDGAVVPPAGVVRHDADDPYLVVAADRGTADLSDVANGLAEERDLWLGDAFASGGSRGYDHKKEGITARGAWVCVKRHFLEMGIDVESEGYTIGGIGDMSGDVFGNGLLLAHRGQLKAAFDHRHVFLDPDPDPARGWHERKRLFELPGSSWTDYDATLISRGGGVFERSAKRIELSAEARQVLAVERESLSGEEFVRAILRMPVDLLWNGGIGTYVKASGESHADVGDRANDSVRVDASELRARVVGEGGNLGFTQLARVECALAGVRINTDALDNSAGVDLSDHEVNFKIMVAPACADGSLSGEERDELLRSCVEQASASVLAHNASQSRCVSMDLLRNEEDPERLALAMQFLVDRADLDPAVEFLPDPESLRKRQLAANGARGFTRPELSILLGYTKMFVKRELIASQIPLQPALRGLFDSYFPQRMHGDFTGAIARHQLRREITATCLTNIVIDSAGVALVPELVSALGADVADVVAAYYSADRIVAGERLRRDIAQQGADEAARLGAELALGESVRQLASGLLGLERRALLEADELPRWSVGIRTLCDDISEWASAAELKRTDDRVNEFTATGFVHELACEIARLEAAVQVLGALPLSLRTRAPLLETVALHSRVGRKTRISWLLEQLRHSARGDGWSRVAAEVLGIEMLDVQCRLTERLLESSNSGDPLDALCAANASSFRQLEATAARIDASGDRSLASLTVLSQQIRRLC